MAMVSHSAALALQRIGDQRCASGEKPSPSLRHGFARTLLHAYPLWIFVLLVVSAPAFPADDPYSAAMAEARRLSRDQDVQAVTAAYERACKAASTDTQRARAWLELAAFLEGHGEVSPAAEAFQAVLNLDAPVQWQATALERLGRLYQRTGRLDQALSAYQQLETLQGLDPLAAQQAVLSQLRTLQQMGDPQRLVAVASRFLETYGESPFATQISYQLVEALVARGDVQRATAVADKEATRTGGDPNILLATAALVQEAGKGPEAVELVERYIALRPEDAKAWDTAYDLHRRQGTLDQLERRLTSAAKAERPSPLALRRLAEFYMRSQNLEAALAALERLLRAQPDDADAAARAGKILLQLGRPEEAAKHYEQALRLRPGDRQLHTELGAVYSAAGDRQRALATWRQAFGYTAGDLQSARSLGRYLVSRGYAHEAVQLYQEAREAAADHCALAPEVAEAYEALLFIDKAVMEYVKAVQSGPAGHWAGARLQALAVDEAARPEVVASLEEVRKAGPLPEAAQVALGLAYLTAGHVPKAVETFGAVRDVAYRAAILTQVGRELELAGDRPLADLVYEQVVMGEAPEEMRGQVALRLARLRLRGGDWMRALEALSTVDPQGLPSSLADALRLTRADILVLHAGQPEQAAELYAQVAQHTSSQQSARWAAWGMADCAFAAERYEEALAAYEALVWVEAGDEAPAVLDDVSPEPLDLEFPGTEPARPMGAAYAAYQRAEIWFRQGKLRDALKEFERVAEAFPTNPLANDALARALFISTECNSGSPAETAYLAALRAVDRAAIETALALLDRVIAMKPQEMLADDAALLAAQALARYGRTEEALTRLLAIPGQFPQSPLVPRALLEASRLRARAPGGREEALKLLRRVLASYPNTPEALEAEVAIDELLARKG